MLDYELYMRSAAYPRIRKEYRVERWLRVAWFFLMFPIACRRERRYMELDRAAEGKSDG